MGSPLEVSVWGGFRFRRASVGVWTTMLVMGTLYFFLMMIGVFLVRVPADGWKPAGWVPAENNGNKTNTNNHSKCLIRP